MKKRRTPYPTDLTNYQWEAIDDFFYKMRVYKWSKRELVNAVLYITKTGCQWRNLPHDFPPWKTVYYFFRRANINRLWVVIHAENLRDTKSGILAATKAIQNYPGPLNLCADAGYKGIFEDNLFNDFGLGVDISEKIKPKEWKILPWRWIVERIFSWLNFYRRLSKDYGITTLSKESFIKISHIHTLLKRL